MFAGVVTAVAGGILGAASRVIFARTTVPDGRFGERNQPLGFGLQISVRRVRVKAEVWMGVGKDVSAEVAQRLISAGAASLPPFASQLANRVRGLRAQLVTLADLAKRKHLARDVFRESHAGKAFKSGSIAHNCEFLNIWNNQWNF